jgi:hypothetical protein
MSLQKLMMAFAYHCPDLAQCERSIRIKQGSYSSQEYEVSLLGERSIHRAADLPVISYNPDLIDGLKKAGKIAWYVPLLTPFEVISVIVGLVSQHVDPSNGCIQWSRKYDANEHQENASG